MRDAAPRCCRLGDGGRKTSSLQILGLLIVVSCANSAAEEEVSGWFGDNAGKNGNEDTLMKINDGTSDSTATTTPETPSSSSERRPDCRVCAADPAPLSACPSGRTPCGIEGVYSLRANWRCGGHGEGEADALATVATSSIGPHPGDAPPARQVEVALDARAETGYGIVLDRTRQFLARLICHRGNERDCARFPVAAPCPPRIVRDNGMCVFADATGAVSGLGGGYEQTVRGGGGGGGDDAAAENLNPNSGGGSVMLTFAWDPPEWQSCKGLDRGLRADAAVETLAGLPFGGIPSEG